MIFAVTQIPLAIAEGLLTVVVFNVLEKYSPRKSSQELSRAVREGRKDEGLAEKRDFDFRPSGRAACCRLPSLVLPGGGVWRRRRGQPRSSSRSSNPDYEPWFEPLSEPASGEVESLLFALQAAVGSGWCALSWGASPSKPGGRAEQELTPWEPTATPITSELRSWTPIPKLLAGGWGRRCCCLFCESIAVGLATLVAHGPAHGGAGGRTGAGARSAVFRVPLAFLRSSGALPSLVSGPSLPQEGRAVVGLPLGWFSVGGHPEYLLPGPGAVLQGPGGRWRACTFCPSTPR